MDDPEIDRHDKADQGYREQQALDDVETERLHVILLANADSLQAIRKGLADLLLLPYLLEERDGPSTPLRHSEAVEFFIPDVHSRQRIQWDHGNLTCQDVLILIEELCPFLLIERRLSLVDDGINPRIAVEEIVLASWLDLRGVIAYGLDARIRHALQAEDRKDPIDLSGIPDGVDIAGPLVHHHVCRDPHGLELLLENL